MRRAVGLAVAFAATACSYDFKNPAENLGTGQALGRVVVDRGAGAQPLEGTLIALENSFSSNQVTRSTGRFTLLSLPIGQHRVLFRKGTQWAAERIVEIVPGDDGKPEGLNLGDIRLRYTVTVAGTFSLGSAYGRIANPFFDVTDEVSGQPGALATVASSSGKFSYSFRGLAPGTHRIRFVVGGRDLFSGERVTFGAPPLTLQIPESSEGQQLTMNDVPLDPAAVGTDLGSFRFRIQAVGPNGPASAAASTVQLYDAATYDPLATNTAVDTLRPDSAGFVQADEPAGLYVVQVVPPQPVADVFYEPPGPTRILVRAGAFADLGTFYLVDSFTGSNAAFACFSDAECQAPGTCVNLKCQGGSPVIPASPAPFSTPFCVVDPGCDQATSGNPCGVTGRGLCLNYCPDASTTLAFCFDSVSSRCTPDGVTIATGTFGNCLP
jgi:hypothetical protein